MGGKDKYSMTGDKFSNSKEKMRVQKSVRHSMIVSPSKKRFESILEQPENSGNNEVLNDIKSQLSQLLNKKDTDKRKSKDREYYKEQINQMKFTICELEQELNIKQQYISNLEVQVKNLNSENSFKKE
jgi:hypothetical protein